MAARPMLESQLETAALNAWPATEQVELDGWLLRSCHGYTKRANSVTVLRDTTDAPEEKVSRCEAFYRARGLPPVFRLLSFTAPGALDRALEQRGYRIADPTRVLTLALPRHSPHPPPGSVQLRVEPLDEWLALYGRFHGLSAESQRPHAAILEAIPGRRILASLFHDGEPVACGMGVLEGDLFGLFDLVTAPERRGRGFGTALVTSLLARAEEQGARLAYLQVVERNEGAARLYARLGFEECYRYWYRVLPA